MKNLEEIKIELEKELERIGTEIQSIECDFQQVCDKYNQLFITQN